MSLTKEKDALNEGSMETLVPQNYRELCAIREKLEIHYTDMQDIEFTVQKGPSPAREGRVCACNTCGDPGTKSGPSARSGCNTCGDPITK